ncbi:hypothetical protein C0J08_05190 [Marinomonas sp. CT5]|nr:hypothetical protein C0J08_05190 [Marinomonas sp. CT5]
MLATRIFTLITILFALSGCGKTNEDLASLNNVELRKKWRECAYQKAPTSTEQKICNNYEKECNARKDKDNLACY